MLLVSQMANMILQVIEEISYLHIVSMIRCDITVGAVFHLVTDLPDNIFSADSQH